MLKAFFRLPPHREKMHSPQRTQDRGEGHHGSGGPGPLCPVLLRTVVHLRGGCPRHVGSQGGLLGEHPVPSLRLGQRRANEGPDFEGNQRGHRRHAQRQSAWEQWHPDRIFPGISEEISPTLLQAFSAMLKRGGNV